MHRHSLGAGSNSSPKYGLALPSTLSGARRCLSGGHRQAEKDGIIAMRETPPGWKPIDEPHPKLTSAFVSRMPSARIACHFPAKEKMAAGSILAPVFVLT